MQNVNTISQENQSQDLKWWTRLLPEHKTGFWVHHCKSKTEGTVEADFKK